MIDDERIEWMKRRVEKATGAAENGTNWGREWARAYKEDVTDLLDDLDRLRAVVIEKWKIEP